MKNKTWILLFAVLLIGCAGLSAFLLMPGEDAAQAEIWSDGELKFVLDLHVNQEITIDSENGKNIVAVQDGKIGVTQADCPDGYCMERGFCSSGAQIVCLPNRLVIKFVGEQAIDAAVG